MTRSPFTAIVFAFELTHDQNSLLPLFVAAIAHPDEILRTVADRMATLGIGALPVVSRVRPGRLEGLITQFDLLDARQKHLEEKRHAERVLTLRRVTSAPTPTVARVSSTLEEGPPAPADSFQLTVGAVAPRTVVSYFR